MWFRNLRLYRLPAGGTIETSALEDAMQKLRTRDTASHEARHLGWAPPGGRKSEVLAHAVQGQHLITMQRQERMLPAPSSRRKLRPGRTPLSRPRAAR